MWKDWSSLIGERMHTISIIARIVGVNNAIVAKFLFRNIFDNEDNDDNDCYPRRAVQKGRYYRDSYPYNENQSKFSSMRAQIIIRYDSFIRNTQ